jgi:hypothetical protein
MDSYAHIKKRFTGFAINAGKAGKWGKYRRPDSAFTSGRTCIRCKVVSIASLGRA